MEKSRDVTPEL